MPGPAELFSPVSGSRKPQVPTSTPASSVDQVAAQRIGHLTRFPSLELTCDAVQKVRQLRFRIFLRLPVQPGLEQPDHAPAA